VPVTSNTASRPASAVLFRPPPPVQPPAGTQPGADANSGPVAAGTSVQLLFRPPEQRVLPLTDAAQPARPGPAPVRTEATNAESPGVPAAGTAARPGPAPDLAGLSLPPLRDYQSEIVSAVVNGLADGGRGQVRAACGTGKSLMALHSALRLCPDGLIVIACHSLPLVAQTLQVWAATGAARQFLAVCSDPTVGEATVKTDDLDCPVTTDPDEIARWIRHTRRGLRLMLVTHLSSDVLGQGLLTAGVCADLLIVDEAHRTAGAGDKHGALMHDDDHLPAQRRLYLTATPRVFGAQTGRRRGSTALLASMDNPHLFGPVLYDYTFGRGISDGWLDDYRLVAIGVTTSEALAILRRLDPDAIVDGSNAPLLTTVVQTALIRAATTYDLRRILVFHSRIAQSKEFTRTLHRRLEAFDEAQRPAEPLTARHVDGSHTTAERNQRLAELAHPPDGGWTVLSNSRCLSEGLDVPAVDSIVYATPKESPPDVIQTLGRGLRRSPNGSGVATVLIPVLLPDNPDDTAADLQADATVWATMLNVLRALRSYDGTLAAELDTQRQKNIRTETPLPSRIIIQLPDGYGTEQLLQQITVRVLEDTTSDWLVGYAALEAFHAEHGHFRVPVDHVIGDISLSGWVSAQRLADRQGRLADERRQRMEAIGFIFDPTQEAWQRHYAAAQAFHAVHDHLRIPARYQADGISVGRWLRAQLDKHATGALEQDKARLLEAIGVLWPDTSKDTWEEMFATAEQIFLTHGSLRIKAGELHNGVNLYDWICYQRAQYHQNKLSPDRVDRLEAIGISWTPKDEAWERGFAAAAQFRAEHGHLHAPRGHVIDEIRLDHWLGANIRAHHVGTLPPERTRRLEALGITWSARTATFDRLLTAAEKFRAEHGHLHVPADHLVDGLQLKTWLATQRYQTKKGTVPAERLDRLVAAGIVAPPGPISDLPAAAT
jgi:superfamily II DNA or RNA helicase